jgi:DNA repair protein RadC
MNVKLTAAQKEKPTGSYGIAEVMQGVLKRENKMSRAQEHFWIIGLNNANKILFAELLALGRHNRAIINPPETFRMAIYKMAVKVVLVHNHPSGALKPSQDDIDLTDHLTKAGEFLKVEVLDHIIISETEYFSFLEKGLMREINESPTWRLVKKETKALEDMRNEIELEKKKREWAKDMASKLKAKGLPLEQIKELTGVTLPVIKKL